MLNKEEKYMKIALNQAIKAFKSEEIPVGAVIVKNDIVISKAHNLKDSKGSVTKHAELLAIDRASKRLNNWRLDDCTMYVTLQPCPMCASAIQQARIENLCYGAKSNNIENVCIVDKIFNSKGPNRPVNIISGVLENESTSLLLAFFKGRRI